MGPVPVKASLWGQAPFLGTLAGETVACAKGLIVLSSKVIAWKKPPGRHVLNAAM